MTALTAFYNDVVPHVPGCPLAMVDYHIRRAAVEFQQASGALEKTAAALDVLATPGDITLSAPALPTNHMLLGVKAAWWFGTPLTLRAPDAIASYLGDDWQSQTGTPLFLTQLTDDTVRLAPQPDSNSSGALSITFTYSPTDAIDAIATALYDRWRDEIAAGALARLLRMKKPWGDAGLADYYEAKFEAGMGSLHLKRVRGVAGAPLRTRPHAF